MTIHLKPELEALIEEEVQRGHYRSADEFVERAVHMLHFEEQLLAARKNNVSAKIDHAFRQAERGELIDGEQAINSLRTHREKRTGT
jgi:putative addiction module CopG family antidote